MQGALRIFDPCRGGGLKKTHKFASKIEFTCFSMGWPIIFMAKKGGPEIFQGLKGWGQKKLTILVFVSGPPYKCLWMVPYISWDWVKNLFPLDQEADSKLLLQVLFIESGLLFIILSFITSVEGFHVTSYQANFASHHTCGGHVGFLFAWPSIGKYNKMSQIFLYR